MKKFISILAACAMLTCAFTACEDGGDTKNDSEINVGVVEYEPKAIQTKWNSAAHSTNAAFSSAIVELYEKDMTVFVDKDKPAVFSSIKNINTANEDELLKYAREYYHELDEIAYVVVIKDYDVIFAAASENADFAIVGVNPTDSENDKTIRQIVESYS